MKVHESSGGMYGAAWCTHRGQCTHRAGMVYPYDKECVSCKGGAVCMIIRMWSWICSPSVVYGRLHEWNPVMRDSDAYGRMYAFVRAIQVFARCVSGVDEAGNDMCGARASVAARICRNM